MADCAGAAVPRPKRAHLGRSRAGAARGRNPTPAGRAGCSAPTRSAKQLAPLTGWNRRATMAMERSELEQRRGELTRSLPGLSESRANTYRRNSEALALDRAGVKHERPEAMVRLGEDEVAADT